ncbi:MAG: type II toxin-antitoxin system VapC family toxin [Myxococcales bacterium]|nr:type II toxin-antitoxin system VapC family toxin [Myxococcales bacterium]
MSGWLLDTNVLSELRRARPAQRVVAFVASQPLASLFVSTVTLAEIRFGIERLDDAVRRRELGAWLEHRVRPMFEQRVLQVSEDVMLEWRVLVEQGRKTGYTYSQPDLIIAATARLHGMTVVSRDHKEYDRAQVPVVNPWSDG